MTINTQKQVIVLKLVQADLPEIGKICRAEGFVEAQAGITEIREQLRRRRHCAAVGAGACMTPCGKLPLKALAKTPGIPYAQWRPHPMVHQ